MLGFEVIRLTRLSWTTAYQELTWPFWTVPACFPPPSLQRNPVVSIHKVSCTCAKEWDIFSALATANCGSLATLQREALGGETSGWSWSNDTPHRMCRLWHHCWLFFHLLMEIQELSSHDFDLLGWACCYHCCHILILELLNYFFLLKSMTNGKSVSFPHVLKVETKTRRFRFSNALQQWLQHSNINEFFRFKLYLTPEICSNSPTNRESLTDPALNWFKTFLSVCTQFIQLKTLKSQSSQPSPITGVPQGSVYFLQICHF